MRAVPPPHPSACPWPGLPLAWPAPGLACLACRCSCTFATHPQRVPAATPLEISECKLEESIMLKNLAIGAMPSARKTAVAAAL